MQKRKLNISMMLKVPLDLEIEVIGVPPINNYSSLDRKENQKLSNFTEESKAEFIINRARLADLPEHSHVLVKQIVEQLEQTQYQRPKEHVTAIQPRKPHKKKTMTRVLDTFNDGFSFVLNTMGTVLFLGKLANYSWE